MDGPDERVIPGNALAVAGDLPYRGLERFGTAFLNKFEGSQTPSQVLRNITLIDTPGILSGEKQRLARGYDFAQVCQWFANRSDLILLLFDAHKLDISDELKGVIESLKGHDDKIRCVLNKADQVDRQKLMRVYGALMWSMGKVLKTPEVLRVYVGSFWDQPLMYEDNAALFEMEERDLMRDLRDLPRNSAVRKINELVKRVRLAKVHAYIIGYLKEQMPVLMGKERKQEELLNDLPGVFRSVMKRYNLAPGDFPDLEQYRARLREEMDFSKFPKLKPQIMEQVESVLAHDIPRLMEALPRSLDRAPAAPAATAVTGTESDDRIEPLRNDAIPQVPIPERARASDEGVNPFDDESKNPFEEEWDLEDYMLAVQQRFKEAGPVNGRLTAQAARVALLETGLNKAVLRTIWELSDIDRDGELDLEEFTVAMHLAEVAQSGDPLPTVLPDSIVPPSKRR
jgi:hypothetical protein